MTVEGDGDGGGGPGGAEEGVGESSSPPRAPAPAASGGSGGGGRGGGGGVGGRDVCREVFERLVADGHVEAAGDSGPELRAQLEAHFARLPTSYQLDVNVDKAEDVLIHQKVLAEAKDPDRRPAFVVRFLRLEEVNVAETTNSDAHEEGADIGEALSTRSKAFTHIHEILFSTTDKPKLLSQLSALLSDIGLNIREAHVFSTTDGYSLDAFVVDGWSNEDSDGLHKALEASILRNEGSWSGSDSSTSGKSLPFLSEDYESDIDTKLLKIVKKVASGSCGDMFLGTYGGEEVAVKVLSPENFNQTAWSEFKQEIYMLREVDHPNIVRYIGSCTKPPQFYIITERMSRGSLFDFLHNEHNVLDLPTILKFALDICRGMSYLHQKGIIHRDLKSANLLLGKDHVVRVADFGLARFQDEGGAMTAETGTYRWMAPEVINHQPYDNKADVYSFAIVLSELMTSKIPYTTMSPLQAAVGVRQGLRPQLPENAHPRLLILMQRCWEALPSNRPSFADIVTELEDIQAQAQGTSGESSQKQKDGDE
ncbi:serine/threonine-protein kinase STY46-like isoform X2 [Panicum miliaceum]|uniref:Serine/threonine-protein kinase STY46-like isoform X2 n=1 Tax=Panicum miliaceum TaxID=4540 RepID=A0A3L6Q3J0_PANMI|nr:serine/threonine-protein kinase STY46-like isoform X2 [Panicum miliaceum]